jgi:lipopolysaccharide transport system ATP-binding protein
MKPIIRITNVGKQYRLNTRQVPYETLRDAIAQAVRAPLRTLQRRNQRMSGEMFWALRDVSFEVQAGEVWGIIGSNGAGKSTLLKILSRITEPTTGRIELYGRIGSLLEVGTGFHPELTGRENVYLNGAMLGMKRAEIVHKFDEIVSFSEIEQFIDTPVKFYSSGMYMRLAFAVAAHLEPEILIVDEVLAVGDLSFQKKCLGKMGDVAKAGRTVLFVSHNVLAVQSLCNRIVWLHQGQIHDEGQPSEVVSKYLRTSVSARSEQVWNDLQTAPGNTQIRIRAARVKPANGLPSDPINVSTPIVMEFEYWNLIPGARLNLSIVVATQDGSPIFNSGSGLDPSWSGKPYSPGLFRSSFYIPGDLLNDGTHRVQLYVIRDQSVAIFRLDDILIFDVEDTAEGRNGWYGKWIGAVRPKLEWQTEMLEASATIKAAP